MKKFWHTCKFSSFALLIIGLSGILACKSNNDFESNTECDLTFHLDLHIPWNLSTIVWRLSPFDETNSTNCLNDSCSYFNLIFNDSTYTMTSFLVHELSDTEVDTIRFEESGLFSYTYCHSTNLNANGGHYPGGFTNIGTITFRPYNQDSYESRFQMDELYGLRLNYLNLDRLMMEAYFYKP